MVTIHATNEHAQDVVKMTLEQVATMNHWMIAVWAVEDGRIKLLDRTTWQFPTGDYKAALEQLKASCDVELARISPVKSTTLNDPLPLAILDGIGFQDGIGFRNQSVEESFVEDMNTSSLGEDDVEQI